MKKSVLFIFGLILISLVLGYTLNTFSNGLSEEVLDFRTALNITRYLRIPDYANLTKLNLSLGGHYAFIHSIPDFPVFTVDTGLIAFSYGGIWKNGSEYWTIDSTSQTVYKWNSTGNRTGFNFSVAWYDTTPSDIILVNDTFYISFIYDGAGTDHGYISTFNTSGNLTGVFFNQSELLLSDIAYNGSGFYLLNLTGRDVTFINMSGNLTGPRFVVTGTGSNGIAFTNNSLFVGNNNAVYIYTPAGVYTGEAYSPVPTMTQRGLAGHSDGLTRWGTSPRLIQFLTYGQYPENPYLEIGDTTQAREWNYSGNYSLNNSYALNFTVVNDILNNYCTCDGCSYSGGFCEIPFIFHSDTPGFLQYYDLIAEFGANYRLNITIRDEQNYSLILHSTTIEFSSDNLTDSKTTTTGLLYREDLLPGVYDLKFTVDDTSQGYSSRRYVVTLNNRTTTQLNAFLNRNVSDVTFTVTDKDTSELLEGVLATMYRFLNGSYQAVESHFTDITGRVQFNYQSDTKYRFYFAKSQYQDYIFYLDPVLFSEYDVKMMRVTFINESQDYDKIALIYSPTLFYNDEPNNFTFLIQSPYGELIQYGYILEFPGGTDNQAGTNALGSQLESVNFVITGATYQDSLTLHYWYETDIAGLRNFTRNYDIVVSGYNQTWVGIRDQTYGLGLFERLLILVLGSVIIVGIATLIGRPIPGMALGVLFMGIMAYMKFVPLWSVLISITVSLVIIGSQSEV